MSIWGKLLGGIAGAGLSIALPGVGSLLAPVAGSLVGSLFGSSQESSNQQQNQQSAQTNQNFGDNLLNFGLNTAMGVMPDIIKSFNNNPKQEAQPNISQSLRLTNPEDFYLKRNIGNSFDINKYFRKQNEGMFGSFNDKGYLANTDIGGGIYTDILRRYWNGTN